MASVLAFTAGFLKRNTKAIGIAAALLLLASLLLDVRWKVFLVVPVLILVASFSTFYFNYVSLPVNFELVKLSTILASVSYGVVPGIVVGISSTFFGKVLIGRIDEKLPLSMLAISLVAIAASAFSTAGITQLGIALVFSYNIVMLLLSTSMGGDLAWNIPYEGTNLLFNALIFAKIAPALLALVR